jgi:transposase
VIAAQLDIPPLFDGAEAIERGWAAIALYREGRSFREIGRLVGCSHPHVSKLIAAWRADRKAVEDHLAASGYLV